MNLQGRDFLTLLDYTPEEIAYLLDLAAQLKAKKKAGVLHDVLRGKNVALIFEKTSTRTRSAFEVAAHDLGMGTTYLDPAGSQIGKKESIADTAQVLSGMFEGIEYRGYGQEIVRELAKYADVPVWNGLTNEFHPTQILADFLTLQEQFGHLKGLKFVYMGDARYNMGNSLMIGCAKMGLDFVACAPKAYWPDAALVARYHRRRDPSRRQRRFAALDATEQRAVRQLAALLRLADALDYSHTGAIGKLEARLDGDTLVVKVKSALGCSAELHRLESKAELFRQVYEKEVRWQCKGQGRA